MSLLGAIRLAGNTLRADQIAMQVIGQNIANANTPGYIREEVVLSPGPTQQFGPLLLGTGVTVDAVIQKIDYFLEDRLRASVSDRADTDAQEEVYLQLEGLIGELTDTDLSSSLSKFFSSISEVLNQPESVAARNLAVLEGTTLAGDISRLAQRVVDLRADVNGRIQDIADRINRLTEEISGLNLRIAEVEGGSVSQSDAVGLRDQRLVALEELAGLIGIRVQELQDAGVAVYAGGEYLVYGNVVRQVEAVLDSDRGLAAAEIRLVETDSPITVTTGELHGLLVARDEILGAFQDRLDHFAHTLAFEFNKVFSSGQGLHGFDEATSYWEVDSADLPLDQAGLRFTPENGSLAILVHNTKTGLSQTTDVLVDLNGLGEDMTLNDLAARLDAIDGISANVSPTGKLTITSESPELQFAFADDTSGVLAALGLNVFFTGSTASGLGVSSELKADPGKFAASRGGIGADVDNAVMLANLLDAPIVSSSGESLSVVYDRMVGDATQGSTVVQAVAEGNRVFEQTLRAQKLATSGVNLDEEAIRLIGFQRSFQASARYISILEELFGLLVNL